MIEVARVFLSHASADKPVVRRIAAALRDARHDPWLDEDEILVGESIPAAVERGLRDADFVVLCLSKAAAERGWVDAERDATWMQQLHERKERILPVRLEDVAPPYLAASLAYVDLFPDEHAFTQGIARLTRSIEAHEARHATRGDAEVASTRMAVAAKPPRNHTRWLAVASVACVSVATWFIFRNPTNVTLTPGSATPGSATPGSATPGSATPGSATPGSATPGSATTGSATPEPIFAHPIEAPQNPSGGRRKYFCYYVEPHATQGPCIGGGCPHGCSVTQDALRQQALPSPSCRVICECSQEPSCVH